MTVALAVRVGHPAVFSKELYPVFRRLLPTEGCVLDPFAGTGGVHRLATERLSTFGVEIEPEWAATHPDTILGDACELPFGDATFDAVVTSPAYGNRMADNLKPSIKGYTRRSYSLSLGRPLSEQSGARLHWGDPYRDLHTRVWREVFRVLRPGGVFILNIKDHYRGRVLQPVSEWHVTTCEATGFNFTDSIAVATSSFRHGENRDARADELVIAMVKPAVAESHQLGMFHNQRGGPR